MSTSAITAIIEQRRANGPFTSIFDFCERVDLRSVNKASIEALIKSGTFDSVHDILQRAAVLAAVTDAITAGQAAADDRRNGQMNFFNTPAAPETPDTGRPLPGVPPWDRMKTLAFEKETLGFHVSGHPLDLVADKMTRFCTHDVRAARELKDNSAVKFGGVLSQVRTRIVRSGRSAGQKMAIAGFSDKTGSVDIVLFTDAYARFAQFIANDEIVALVGRVDHTRGEPNVIVDEVIPIDQIDNHLAGRMDLELIDEPGRPPIREVMIRVDQTLREAKTNGERSVDVLLHVLDGDKTITLRPNRLKVVPDSDLVDRLKQMLGPQHVRLVDAASSTR